MNLTQMKNTVLAVLAAAGSAVAQALGGWDVALKVLICFMALDYVTGWLVAAVWHKSAKSKTGALDSKARYNGLVKKEDMRIETGAGVREVHLYTANGLVTSACVDMGRASLDAAAFRFAIAEKTVVDYPVYIGGQSFNITCVDVGEPHCVAFCPRLDDVDVEFLGPRFEQAPYFPERINAEFIRVVNPSTIKMRVWERGSGEIMASGTGACAAVVAAVANGMCEKGRDMTVRAAGGDLVVNYTDEKITLTGDAKLVYTGEAEY